MVGGARLLSADCGGVRVATQLDTTPRSGFPRYDRPKLQANLSHDTEFPNQVRFMRLGDECVTLTLGEDLSLKDPLRNKSVTASADLAQELRYFESDGTYGYASVGRRPEAGRIEIGLPANYRLSAPWVAARFVDHIITDQPQFLGKLSHDTNVSVTALLDLVDRMHSDQEGLAAQTPQREIDSILRFIFGVRKDAVVDMLSTERCAFKLSIYREVGMAVGVMRESLAQAPIALNGSLIKFCRQDPDFMTSVLVCAGCNNSPDAVRLAA